MTLPERDRDLTPEEITVHLFDNYGTCKRGPACVCLKTGWPRPCPTNDWEPAGVATWNELLAWQRRQRDNCEEQ